MNDLGKILVTLGLVLIGIGLLLWSGHGRNWIGKLPGDLYYTRGNFSVYLPIVSCLIVSVVITIIFWLFKK